MTTIDLSLTNEDLYSGCEIENVNGRLNLKTKISEAASIVGNNINKVTVDEEVTLTGPMAVWAYMIVFHSVVHRCRRLYYSNGRESVLIAAHG